jgi:hypothetical protein
MKKEQFMHIPNITNLNKNCPGASIPENVK